MKWLGGVRAVGATAVIAALVAALTIGVSTQVLHRTPSSPQFALTAGSGFIITSTISSSSTSQVPAKLDLGVQRYLWYNVSNPLSVPMTVTSMSISGVSAPAGCATSPNLDLSQTTFSGTLVVPKAVGSVDGTNSVAVPIKFLDLTGTKQNDPTSLTENCAGKTFGFAFTGSAFYTEVYSTTVAITSAQNPSVIGQAVTYTATVKAAQGAGQDPVPSTPTGSVTFKDNGTAICTTVPVSPGTVSSNGSTASGTATCSPSAYIANGTHPITAVFTSSDTTEFANSPASPVINQVVNATPPAQCTGTFSTTIVGTPSNTTISASNSNYAIFAFGANYIVTAGQGNDCLDAGDGNNSLTAGNGTDNVVAGNGNDTVNLGNGTDSATLGNGTETVVVGNGTDKVAIGNGSNSTATGGNNPDTVTIGSGSHNTIKLGDGANTVTINGGSNDTITVGSGANTVFLGSGTSNTFKGGSGHNTCHVPSGSTAASLHDTVTNCTVVSP